MQTGCCYGTCQGHHILTGNSSSVINFVSALAEVKPNWEGNSTKKPGRINQLEK